MIKADRTSLEAIIIKTFAITALSLREMKTAARHARRTK
jgi:hypothetical protein